MAGSFIKVEIAGVTYILDTSVETLKFIITVSASGGTAQSMVDTTTNADYQVTAGKTFTVLGGYVVNNTTAGNILIYQADSADATTTLKATFTTGSDGADWQIPLSFTVAAAKFVTCDPAAASIINNLVLIGYES